MASPDMTVGIKQTMRMLERDMLDEIFIAKDADQFVTRPVIEAASVRGLTVTYIDSKRSLGHICGIDTGTAVAGRLSGSDDTPGHGVR